MGEQIFKMADLLRFFAFYENNLTLSNPVQIVMHVTNKQFSDKFDNGGKKRSIYCDFRILRQKFYLGGSITILPKFVMHVTNDQFSDKFDNGWKKQNGRFLAILRIFGQ